VAGLPVVRDLSARLFVKSSFPAQDPQDGPKVELPADGPLLFPF